MATYKVPQDVEAEDKLLGPFTLKQFIFLIIVVISLWLTFIFARSTVTYIFLPLTITPALFFGLLVFLGIKNQSQPAENYLAAIVRFYFKPHKRIWSQDGYMETVHITAPKREERHYSDSLSRSEVRGRLSSLANLMDSRGWAAKDVRYQPNVVMPNQQGEQDDRLVSLNQLPQTFEPTDVHASDDVMDEINSPIAQQFDDMIRKNQDRYKHEAVAHMNDPNYDPYPNMRQHVIKPLDENENPKSTGEPKTPSKTESTQPDVQQMQNKKRDIENSQPTPTAVPDSKLVQLAQNDDLSVQTLASEAERLKRLESGDEINLH